MLFYLKLFESMDAETMGVEGQLCTQNRQKEEQRAKNAGVRGVQNPIIRH